MINFKNELQVRQKYINDALKKKLNDNQYPNRKVVDSMRYSLLAGGKRLRPILMIETYEAFGGMKEDILDLALSMEMIHTYSLIHDDLPAMDNDDYRRGILTNHKVFGEATAILAGDGLLNLAFETMISWAIKQKHKENALEAIEYISKAAGYNGMIGGQTADVLSEGKDIDISVLLYIQEKKTAALLQASMMGSVLALGCDLNICKNVEKYAKLIGVAFQIRDDLLDEISTFEKLGKDIGSDQEQQKNTYLSFHSKDEAQLDLENITKKAVESIESVLKESKFFIEMANYLTNREY